MRFSYLEESNFSVASLSGETNVDDKLFSAPCLRPRRVPALCKQFDYLLKKIYIYIFNEKCTNFDVFGQ